MDVMQLKFALFFALFIGCLNGIVAQEAVADANPAGEKNATYTKSSNNGWSMYLDEENQIYYIDFETLSVNLSNIVVKDSNGKLLINDDVFDLPVNTIYELDLTQFANGSYTLELHAFTGVVRQAAFTRS